MSSYTDMFGKTREMPGGANPNQSALQQHLAGPQVFEGFDQSRAQDPKKSAKDSFLSYAKQAPSAPIHDKGQLGGWFDQYILPGMNADGHGVQRAQGDKFRFKNWQGDFNVDFGRGAGAPGGALAWQAEDANMGPSAPVNHLMSQSSTGRGSGLLDAIMASLQAQQEPNAQALLEQALR